MLEYDETSDEPYYIVNLGEITNAYKRWTKWLPNIHPFYAMKCNPDPNILKLLAELGASFDCASKSEMQEILNITMDPSKIIFAHPCKYRSHLDFAKKNDIKMMTFDCEEELHKIKQHHPYAQLLLRLAVDDSQSLCKFNIKFGCPQDNVENLIRAAQNLGLNLIGFSFHVGSGCKSAYTYYDALRQCKKAIEIARTYNIDISVIDIGGGFVAHSEGDVTFEIISAKIQAAITDHFWDMPDIRFIAEPGRFMVQKSHTLVVCVVAKKRKDDGFIYYINDGVYGSFNCIIFDHQEPNFSLFKDASHLPLYKSQIFGNTCDSMDEIKRCTLLPELEVGDYLYVKNFGAYTTSAKSDGFNGYKVTNIKYIPSK